LRLLVKLYAYLCRKTASPFNKLVLKRLCQSRKHQRPITLRRIVKNLAGRDTQKVIAVVVGTVTNDNRMLEVPQGLQVAALRFTETARARIEAHGGKVYTFDQLAQIAPEGKGTVLMRGNYNTESKKHFGVPGAIGSHAKPYVRAKGLQFERARGRRSSKGFKTKGG
jgi:large subunit ribosomal protein L18e